MVAATVYEPPISPPAWPYLDPSSGRKRCLDRVSMGCNVCRIRRVRCDGARPSCRRCRTLNILCANYTPKIRLTEALNEVHTGSSAGSVSSVEARHTDSLTLEPQDPDFSLPLAITEAPNLQKIYEKALIDTFLTTYLPSDLARKHAIGQPIAHSVAMSAWPVVAWKLGKDTENGLVAQSLLCLVLCFISSRTGNSALLAEAKRHYTRVLDLFRYQVSRLAQLGYSSMQNDSVVSIAAAGLCCAAIEYMLQSWKNADQHISGMASILEACGKSCLEFEPTRQIFTDHCLLWTSCSVVHRRTSLYCQQTWRDLRWTRKENLCHSCHDIQKLLTVANQIPSLLQEYDAYHHMYNSAQLSDLSGRLCSTVRDLEGLRAPCVFEPSLVPGVGLITPKNGLDFPQPVLEDLMIKGYSSAFLVHLLVTLWDLNSLQMDAGCPGRISVGHLRLCLERHGKDLCRYIDCLLDDCNGAMMLNPCLFFIDAAWVSYAMLAKEGKADLVKVVPWFKAASRKLEIRGHRPLREAWKPD